MPMLLRLSKMVEGKLSVKAWKPLNILIKPMNPLTIEKMNYLCKLNMLHGNQTWAETCPHWISGIFNKRLKPAFMGDLPAMLVTRKVPWNPLKITIFVLVKTVNPWRIIILCLSSHYFFSRNHQKPPCPMGFSKKNRWLSEASELKLNIGIVAAVRDLWLQRHVRIYNNCEVIWYINTALYWI